MTTITVVVETTVPPEHALAASFDFSERRTHVFPAVSNEYLDVHEVGETSADITEGTRAGIGINWERCRYDWSQPGSVIASVTDSNVYALGSSWQITARPTHGGSHIEMRWDRMFKRTVFGAPVVQLSSRTLAVSVCCWNVVALPSRKVQTWAIFAEAGAPVSLCFHARFPRATTVSPSATNRSGTTAKWSPISPRRMKTPSSTAWGPTKVPAIGYPSGSVHSMSSAKAARAAGTSPVAKLA